jgi:hypothetical protein
MSRAERLENLRDSLRQYVGQEKKRIENEVAVLQAILKGRTAGRGIQEKSIQTVTAVAQSDLASYLQE